MANAWLDACRFTPQANPGTSDFTYNAAVTGYNSPALAGVVNGTVYSYRAESTDLSQWEIGFGAYNTGTGVLSRTTVLFNSSGTGTASGQSGAGSKINFSATTPQIAIVPIKEDLLSLLEDNSFSTAQKSRGRVNLGVPGDNYIMNPSGEVAQIGYGYSQGDVTYDFDQWLTLVQTAAVTVTSLNIANVGVAEDSTPFMMRTTQSQASAQRFGRIQWIENRDCMQLRGKTVVLSARVRMSATTTLRYAIVEWTGTADTITKDIVLSWTSGTFTAGNFFTSTSTVVTATGSVSLTANTLTDITVLTGTIGSSMTNLAVFFWTDSTQAQNVTLDIAKVKLEEGTLQTPFVHPDFHTEKMRCMRYFETSFPYGVLPQNGASATAYASGGGQISFFAAWISTSNMASNAYYKTPKRQIPTITAYGNSAGNLAYMTSGVLPTNQTAFTWSSGITLAAYDETKLYIANNVAQTVLFEILGGWVADARL